MLLWKRKDGRDVNSKLVSRLDGQLRCPMVR